MRAARRILLIKPSSLGDIIHALPMLAGLRQAYPQAHIAWLVGAAFAPLLAGHPLIDELIPFDRRAYGQMLRRPRHLLAFGRFVRSLRRRRFDMVIDLQGLVRSGFLAWASGAPRRVGFADAREFAWLFYTHRVRPRACSSFATAPRVLHAVDKNLAVARTLGLPVDPPQFPLALRAAELTAARQRLTGLAGRPLPRFIAVVPGARWPTKQWSIQGHAAVLDQLAREGHPPAVLLGGPEDRALADAICAACATAPLDLVGRTSLRELCAILALADLVLCQDSGPMHIAAALSRPLVAIFGPTDPQRTGPYSAAAQVVRLRLPCMPCYARRCPLGHHACLAELEPAAVVAAISATLRRGRVLACTADNSTGAPA
jgi:lipopolysaccharide heptosyltransferase II